MIPFLIFLLFFYQLQPTTHGELLNAPKNSLDIETNPTVAQANEIDEVPLNPLAGGSSSSLNDLPMVRGDFGQTVLRFRRPILSLNINYAKNVIVVKFRHDRVKQNVKALEKEDEFLENNFMRLGRSSAKNAFMRLGKRRQLEGHFSNENTDKEFLFVEEPKERNSHNNEVMRDSRGDNFMRLGRASKNFRFGKAPSDFMRFGRSRFESGEVDMPSSRFPNDFMRFGRSDNFMRLGRGAKENADNSENFIQFGKRIKNVSKAEIEDNKIKAGTLDEHDKDQIESNPMDNAMKVFYGKSHEDPAEGADRNQKDMVDIGHMAANLDYASGRTLW